MVTHKQVQQAALLLGLVPRIAALADSNPTRSEADAGLDALVAAARKARAQRARAAHPDLGGHTADMQTLNAAVDAVVAWVADNKSAIAHLSPDTRLSGQYSRREAAVTIRAARNWATVVGHGR